MGSCEGCIQSIQQLQQQYSDTVKKAVEYATKTNQQMVIFQEAGQWAYATLERAIAEAIPFNQVVSKHYGANT